MGDTTVESSAIKSEPGSVGAGVGQGSDGKIGKIVVGKIVACVAVEVMHRPAQRFGPRAGEAIEKGFVDHVDGMRGVGRNQGAGERTICKGLRQRDGLRGIDCKQTTVLVVSWTARDYHAPIATRRIVQDKLHLVTLNALDRFLKHSRVRMLSGKRKNALTDYFMGIITEQSQDAFIRCEHLKRLSRNQKVCHIHLKICDTL